MAKSNTSSVRMDTGLKNTYLASQGPKNPKGFEKNPHKKNEVNASKGPRSEAQKKKAKARAKQAKKARKRNK